MDPSALPSLPLSAAHGIMAHVPGATLRNADAVHRWLARAGLSIGDLPALDVHIPAGEQWVIPACADRFGGVTTLTTKSLSVYKRWLGFRNEDVRAGVVPPPADAPASSAPPSGWLSLETLDGAQRQEGARAARAFLYGDSEMVAAWVPFIERHYGPFPVAVVRARSLVIGADAELVVRGMPMALLLDALTLEPGGHVSVYEHAHLAIGTFDKINPELS